MQPVLIAVVLAIAPAALIAGYSFERQIVPDEICSRSHIPLQVGAQCFDVPLAFGRDVLLSRVGNHTRISQDVRHKEDLRRLCDATSGGLQPAQADQIWLAPSLNAQAIEQFCTRNTALSFCAGFQSEYARNTGSLRIEKPTDR